MLSRYAPQGVAPRSGTDGALTSTVTSKPTWRSMPISTRGDAGGGRALAPDQIWPVIPEPVFRPVAAQAWPETWKEQIQVLHLGRRVGSSPPGAPMKRRRTRPCWSWTGARIRHRAAPYHALCVAAIEDYLQPGATVLDLGTGTGILAMVAAGSAPSACWRSTMTRTPSSRAGQHPGNGSQTRLISRWDRCRT